MSELVVSASWLAERLGDADVRVVDVRDAWEFEGIGHVPGAVNVPFDRFRADAHAAQSEGEVTNGDDGTGESGENGGGGMLPGAAVFADLMSEAGIAPDDHVVAYDDTHGVFAARFLVTALLYGHPVDRLHLLDGDFSAWRLDHETASDVPGVAATDYTVERPAESPLVGMDEVAAAVESDAVLVDTREDWEFEEGHIPGAVRLDWRELVDDETRGLKPRAEMDAILSDRGVDRADRIVLYCNTARRISHTYWVLRHLDFENVDFYEGSLAEWEAADRELATGS